MKILWISSLAWNYDGNYQYPVNGAGAVSGSLFEQSLIEGLEELGHSVDIVCDYPYKKNKFFHKSFKWSHNKKNEDVVVSSIEIPYISILFKEKFILKAVKSKLKNCEYDVVISYLIHQPYMNALKLVKEKNPNIKTVLICPDLPDMMDMSLNQKKFKRFLKNLDYKRVDKLYAYVDGFVLFAEMMKEHIKIYDKPYEIIEGVPSVKKLDISPVEKEKYILYAGTLHKNMGIQQIIKSLEYVSDSELKLMIFGTGELEEYVKEISKTNSRVIYGGFIDRDELFIYQKKALALINARNPEDEYTKYSFPSKTFEYLYSGTPFITTKLKGIPKEYSEYLYEIDDNMPRNIANAVNSILKLEQKTIEAKGNEARKFIDEQKNYIVQSIKLMEFVKRINII